VTQPRTGLAILLALSSAAPSIAQMAPAATEEPGCHAHLVYPPPTTTATARQSQSCEPGEGVWSYDRAARPDAALEEHAFNRADASLAEGRVP
jgi:hypothetical protein